MAANVNGLLQCIPEDLQERRDMLAAARKLVAALETPQDVHNRITCSRVQEATAAVGIDLNIFKLLSDLPSRTWHVEELARTIGADAVLLLHLMRAMATYGLLDEVSFEKYRANKITEVYTSPAIEAAVQVSSELAAPILNAFPKYLKSLSYKTHAVNHRTAFNEAFHTDLEFFDWIQRNPEKAKFFSNWMKTQRVFQKGWMHDPDIMQYFKTGESRTRILFVDIGGGIGHQCLALRKKHPELHGRVILQDLPRMLKLRDEASLSTHNVETMEHDMFWPQPTKDAKVYYLRNVLHDWPDDDCVLALQRLKDAMAPDSVVLIDDIVMTSGSSAIKPINFDILMMAWPGGMERTEVQWRTIVERAGLKVDTVYCYEEETLDSLVIVRLP